MNAQKSLCVLLVLILALNICALFGAMPLAKADVVSLPFLDDFEDGLGYWSGSGGVISQAGGYNVTPSNALRIESGTAMTLANNVAFGADFYFGFTTNATDTFSAPYTNFTVSARDASGNNSIRVTVANSVGYVDPYDGYWYSDLYIDIFSGGVATIHPYHYLKMYTADNYTGYSQNGNSYWQSYMFHVISVGEVTTLNVFIDGVFEAVYAKPSLLSLPVTLEILGNSGIGYVDDVRAFTSTVVPSAVVNEYEGDFDYYTPLWSIPAGTNAFANNYSDFQWLRAVFVYESLGYAMFLSDGDGMYVANLTTGEFITAFEGMWYYSIQSTSIFQSYVALSDDQYDVVTLMILKNGAVLQTIDLRSAYGWGGVDNMAMTFNGKYIAVQSCNSPEEIVLFEGHSNNEGTDPTPSPSVTATPTTSATVRPTPHYTTVNYSANFVFQADYKQFSNGDYAFVANASTPINDFNMTDNGVQLTISYGIKVYVINGNTDTKITSGDDPILIGTVLSGVGVSKLSSTFGLAATALDFGRSALRFDVYYSWGETATWQLLTSYMTDELYTKQLLACSPIVIAYGDLTNGTATFVWGQTSAESWHDGYAGVYHFVFRSPRASEWQSYYLTNRNLVMFTLIPYTAVIGNLFYAIILFGLGMTVYARYRTLSAVVFFVLILTAVGCPINLIAGQVAIGFVWLVMAIGIGYIYWRFFR